MINWEKTATWQVLLVDDQPDILALLERILRRSAVKVHTALNGKEALKAMDEFTPDLIITDLSMPVMNGWQLLTHLKNDPRFQHIPVFALTALATARNKEQSLTAGFDGLLTKPVNATTLVDDLRAAAKRMSVS